jgi:hypothetical protein
LKARGWLEAGEARCKPVPLDQVRDLIRVKHYSIRTETQYVQWVKHFHVVPLMDGLPTKQNTPRGVWGNGWVKRWNLNGRERLRWSVLRNKSQAAVRGLPLRAATD